MIVSYGEALIDLVEERDGRFLPCPGGSVYNFALATARQKVASVYANPLSFDGFGRAFERSLSTERVQLMFPQPSSCPTSLAVATVNPATGAASYVFHRQGVADRDVDPERIARAWPDGASALHTGCLMLVPQDLHATIEVMELASTRGAVVSVDANMRPAVVQDRSVYRNGVLQALARAHVIKASDEDLGCLGFASSSLEDLDLAARTLFDAGCASLVALTRGARGGVLYTRGQRVVMGVPAGTRVVDTIGAGDCFHAGLLSYLSRQRQLSLDALSSLSEGALRVALAHAIATATLDCMFAGCVPPDLVEAEVLARRLLAQ